VTDDDLVTTRRAWHGLAELVLAGPQYRTSATIRLRITPGGFATVAAPNLRVDGEHLVADEDVRIPLAGQTYAEVGRRAGVGAGRPDGLYAEGSGAHPEDVIELSGPAVARLAEAFARGDAALRALAPEQVPVLWPEHFDLAVSLDEVNYGVSPGDTYLAEPYAYVGPWRPRVGPFWNAPFGALRPLRELPDADAVLAFFTQGRTQANSVGTDGGRGDT
jgi:hypothetical protein